MAPLAQHDGELAAAAAEQADEILNQAGEINGLPPCPESEASVGSWPPAQSPSGHESSPVGSALPTGLLRRR